MQSNHKLSSFPTCRSPIDPYLRSAGGFSSGGILSPYVPWRRCSYYLKSDIIHLVGDPGYV